MDHLEESLSTCRFAQRCAQLSMDVLVNEEIDPYHLSASLQAEVQYYFYTLKDISRR